LGACAGTQYLDGGKGWRTLLALAALPALVLTIGSLILACLVSAHDVFNVSFTKGDTF
jgi:hypothetical protein